ncbi:CDGSH iron-sulfur domain-containing protein 3, mitochondrial-like [Acipenser oxyrinchus oxyrinchus]|uniref:CDGSH iron-sulfur domain-containing protein 3, mitochondrial-like n=1 Tax=Acipenser oxyrinchus oxyrinchus TaxID=40147 RepID=A0AAD8D0M6_ACIOX|nr:CDGSH iron-sulfur domain-containing protein 3, mitochondrial-like [Acipenser oxyrinchus oxyrinchus]
MVTQLLYRAGPAVLKRNSCILARAFRVQSCYSSSTTEPKIAAKHPFKVDLEGGKRYSWCTCGYSKKQPFCDGSHKKSSLGLSPLRFTLEEAKTVWLCGCKQTHNPPYCDGTHKQDFVQEAEVPAQQ